MSDDFQPSESEQKLLNIGRIGKKSAKPSKPPKGTVKRGRPPKAKKEEIVFEEEPEPERDYPHDDPDAGVLMEAQPEQSTADFAKLVQMCSIIDNLKRKMGAIGKLRNPDPHTHTREQLQEEIDLLNTQIDSARGEPGFKMLVIKVIAPLIERVSEAIAVAAINAGGERPCDLTGYGKEIEENWDDVLGHAAMQIYINNPGWFAAGPYAEMGKGLFFLAHSTNFKNQKAASDTNFKNQNKNE